MTKSAIDLMVEYLDSSASIGASRSENIRIAKRLQAEEKSKPAPVEAKATAPFRPSYCPTCQAYIKSTERRIDGDSVCINGHKHKTAEFFRYRPAPSSAYEELRKIVDHAFQLLPEVSQVLDGWHNDGTTWTKWDESVRKRVSMLQAEIDEALSRHPTPAKDEPLAVLADNHGWDLQITGPAFGPQFNHKWEVCITNPKGQCKTFYDDDCVGAENRARAYLNSLPDKEGK